MDVGFRMRGFLSSPCSGTLTRATKEIRLVRLASLAYLGGLVLRVWIWIENIACTDLASS